MEIVSSKAGDVRSFFEKPVNYLNRREVLMRVRAETVRALAETFTFHSVLDIGCGDGSISIPLLRENTRLTLLDFSTGMTSLARSKVPRDLAGNVEYLNDNFMSAGLKPRSYDLVICLGVLAHLDSPADFLARVANVLKPEGRLILQFSDSRHPIGRLQRAHQRICAIRRPRSWSLNAFSSDLVSRMLAEQGLQIISAFRYSLLPIPGLVKWLSHENHYRIIRGTFGDSAFSRNAWLGNEYMCVVRHGSETPHSG
jgi:2-polyprenyl-3-methyl-5-hydroxy-6-metoxy-1,4-benzoquinol methylase